MKNNVQIIAIILAIIFLNLAAEKIFPYDVPFIAKKIISSGVPSVFVKNDCTRFSFFSVVYTIKNAGNAGFEITLTPKTPIIKVPGYVQGQYPHDGSGKLTLH